MEEEKLLPEQEEEESEVLEIDGKEYVLLMEFRSNASRFYCLVNVDDRVDLLIRKIITRDGERYAIKPETKREYDDAIVSLYKHIAAARRDGRDPFAP